MIEKLYARKTVSVSKLKSSPATAIMEAGDEAVAILSHNSPKAYLVPPAIWEEMNERLEDAELAEIARARANETPVKVNLADL